MMKIKKEYLFIALVIFSLVSYLLIRKSDRTEYQLPAVPKVIAGNITKIEVVRPGETVTLEKIDKQLNNTSLVEVPVGMHQFVMRRVNYKKLQPVIFVAFALLAINFIIITRIWKYFIIKIFMIFVWGISISANKYFGIGIFIF